MILFVVWLHQTKCKLHCEIEAMNRQLVQPLINE